MADVPVLDGITRGYGPRYAFGALARIGLIGKRRRYELGLVDRPHYAYGLMRAAEEARALGYPAITAVEFGVAGGNGLVALEGHADYVTSETGVRIDVVGFDTGSGLPPSGDFRDAPYLWAHGDFAMDEAALRARLRRAALVLGDVRETVRPFVDRLDRQAPVGFVAFDLDLWSSTVSALDLFRGDVTACLPRVWCYFDDIVAMIDQVGELLAIREFNEERPERQLGQPYRLRSNVPFQPLWADQMFQAHFFEHPKYSALLAPPSERELPLR